MPTQIITTDDLRDFKMEMISEIKNLLENSTTVKTKKYLKSSELMELLKVSPGTLQTLRVNGTLPYSKVGGIIFYEYDEILQVIEQNKVQN